METSDDSGVRSAPKAPSPASPKICVFTNVPFDPEYLQLFDAIVFAVVCCGFFPRTAIESGSTSIARMDRIAGALLSSTYSIHDLSRCRGEGHENLARFNMPLELGVAMGLRFSKPGSHDWLAMVPRKHAYQRFVSDLAGYDLLSHDDTLESVVAGVMSRLSTRPNSIRTETPKAVLEVLPEFRQAKSELDDAWNKHAPWPRVVRLAIEVAQTHGLLPPTFGVAEAI